MTPLIPKSRELCNAGSRRKLLNPGSKSVPFSPYYSPGTFSISGDSTSNPVTWAFGAWGLVQNLARVRVVVD